MTRKNIMILYGSETGTAHDVAEEIWKSAKRRGLDAKVSSLDDYNLQNVAMEKIMVFVVATTGQGNAPTNMRIFWKSLLRKNLPTIFQNINYAVLGLGDSSYEKFNFVAKKLSKRLMQLGGKELLPIALADDQHDLGIDAVVDPWMHNLWDKIASFYSISATDISEQKEIILRYDISKVDSSKEKTVNVMAYIESDIYMREMVIRKEMKIGIVIENSRTTTKDHFQDVRLIKLNINNVQYQPGDIIYIRPKNSANQIEKFFHVLNENNIQLHPSMAIHVSEKEIKIPYVLQHDLTLGEIVAQYWDLNFKPTRSIFKILYAISDNDLEKEKLKEFMASSGQEELYNYVNRPHRNIVEVLADFPHTTSKLNVKLLFEIMRPIKPRAFSIASSQKTSKNEIHILVAVVNYKTILVERRFGLCSNWLANLKVGSRVIFWICKGTFVFPKNVPKILIGPGTGIAPFRSLLLEEAVEKEDLSSCILFFGCRYKDKDYHCKEDFVHLSNSKGLKLFCAFSRDQEHKIYVQHIIKKNKYLCWDLIKNGANIYLAGNSKNMPNAVQEAFVDLVEELGQISREEAEKFIEQLKKTNRYQSETWF